MNSKNKAKNSGSLMRFRWLFLPSMGNRQAVLARELTKIYEEVLRGTLEELTTIAEKRKLKGEITIVIAGRSKKEINKGS